MRWTDNVTRRVLPNGLTLLVQRETSAPVVAVVVHVKAGYLDEPDEWVGVSHVLEHMYFKGNATLGPGGIASEIQSLGGYINAGTSYDHTSYYVVVPSGGNPWRRALAIQGDALIGSTIDAGELSREIEVIVQEANRKLDNPASLTRETMYSMLYPDHPMGRWRIGTEDGLRRLTRDDVFGYYRSRYRPDSTIVAVVGDIQPGDVLDEAVTVLGGWDLPAAAIAMPADANGSPPPRLQQLHRDVQRAVASIGWKTVPEADPRAAALDFAAAVLSVGRGSRMYRTLRTPGLVSGAYALHYTPTVLGVFELFLQGEAPRLRQAMATALGAVAELAAGDVSQGEMDRIAALLETERSRQLESMEGRAANLCHHEAGGGFHLADDRWERFLQVTPAEVAEAVAGMLDPLHSMAVVCLPEGDDLVDGEWPFQRVVGAAEPIATTSAPPRRADWPATAIDVVGEVTRARRGATDFLVRPRPGSGVCTVGLYLRGLARAETAATAGLSMLLLRTSLRGIEGHGQAHLAEVSERLGGTLVPVAGRDLVGWAITVRKDECAEAVDLLRRIAAAATLAPDQVALERDQQVSDARSRRDDMFGHPVRQALRNALAGSGYGLPIRGDAENVALFTPADVHEWRDRIDGCQPAVIAVGDLDPAPLLGRLAGAWEWPEVGVPAGEIQVAWTAANGSEARAKEQTALAMAFPAPPFASPDRHPLRILCAILGGMAGRLFEELRERRSLAYTVSAIPWLQVRAGALVTYIATSPDREREARDCMLVELCRVAESGVTDDEVERARTYLVGAESLKLQSSAAVAAEIARFHTSDMLEALPGEIAALQAVSRDDVGRVAAAVFRPDERSEYVVRGGPA